MKNDYLWDGSGEPDPEIQKLESALGKLRHNRPAPVFPAITAKALQPARQGLLQMFLSPRFIYVAAIIALAAGLGLFLFRGKPVSHSQAGWDITAVSGTPRVGSQTVSKAGKFGVGQILETDGRSQASIRDEKTGEIQIEPDSRLRLLNSRLGVKRLALDRGTIHAYIWADPGEFVIDTPSAVAVDLGCAYTLHVDDSGNGVLRTTLGWVGFKFGAREAFIPAGAVCSTRAKTGPDTPYFEDASETFRTALAKFDAENSANDDRAAALHAVLAQSRKRDALTLWHLLSRVEEPERGQVYDRLAKLVPVPAAVTREGVLRLDDKMLDLWWNKLGLGDVSLWRHWQRTWPQKDAH